MSFGRRMRERRELLKITQDELSDVVGVSKTSISKYEKDMSEPAADKRKKIADKLETTEKYLMYGEENNNVSSLVKLTKLVPLISWVQAGLWREIVDNFQPGDAEDWIPTRSKYGPHTFALRIDGDSMEWQGNPSFSEGEIIIVDPDIPAESGKFVVAKTKNGTSENGYATFKKFMRDGEKTYLKPLNNYYDIIDITGREVEIIGCVVGKVSDI